MFTESIRRIDAVPRGGRDGCTIKLKIVGQILGEEFPLVDAGYTPSGANPKTATALGFAQSNEGSRFVDDNRISFYLNATAHEELKARLIRPEEEQSEDGEVDANIN